MKTALPASESTKTQSSGLPQGAETDLSVVPEPSLPTRPQIRRPNVAFRYAGREWLNENLKCMGYRPASDLGNAVGDILGQVFGGLYHLEHTALWHKRTVWHDERVVRVVIRNELATIDFAHLTELVLLTHLFGLRLAIRGASREYVTLQFTTPDMFSGSVPTVSDLAARFAERYRMVAP